MKFWLFMLVAFAMFTTACEEKPTVSLDDSDVGTLAKTEETKNEAEKATAAVEKAKAKDAK